jgi:hypothetical protein
VCDLRNAGETKEETGVFFGKSILSGCLSVLGVLEEVFKTSLVGGCHLGSFACSPFENWLTTDVQVEGFGSSRQKVISSEVVRLLDVGLLVWVEDFDGEVGGCSRTGYENVKTGSICLHTCELEIFVVNANLVVEMRTVVVLMEGKNGEGQKEGY